MPKLPREQRAELGDPATDRLIGNVQPAFGQQILDVAVTQREPQIQPNRVLDDRGREAMAGVGNRHSAISPTLVRFP